MNLFVGSTFGAPPGGESIDKSSKALTCIHSLKIIKYDSIYCTLEERGFGSFNRCETCRNYEEEKER